MKYMNPKNKGCVYLAEFADDSIIGLALELKDANLTRDQIWERLRADIFKAVMLHEVGHTVGLRHNFEGSIDAINYFDEFWALRQLSDPAQQRARKINEYKYSTVMDYGAKFNSDVHGLGRYDKAAIKFGYGQLVEAFRDASVLPVDEPLDYKLFLEDYTKIPDMLGGREKIADRVLLSHDTLMKEKVDGLVANTSAFLDNATPSYVSREVPYKFCSDEFAGYSLTCRVFDEGGNQTEHVASIIEQYKNYYPFSAFKRNRFNWDPNAYLDRLQGRYFENFINAFQWFYYYGRSLLQYDIGKDLAAASTLGLNTIGEVLQTPEPGTYCRTTDPRMGQMYIPESDLGQNQSCTAPVSVPLGKGRYFWLDFSDNYNYQITRIGAYYEKLIALISLMDSTARFARIDAGANFRAYSINYYRLYKNEILNLLGGIVVDDARKFYGRVKDGQYVARPIIEDRVLAGQPSEYETLPLLETYNTYNLRWYGALLGMAYLTSDLDSTMDFGQYFKVSLKGSKDDILYEGIDLTDENLYAEVTNPLTHYTYRAVQTGDNNGFGFHLVNEAKTLKEAFDTAKTALDATTPGTTAWRNAKRNYDRAERNLADSLEFVDDIRLFQSVFEFGTNGG
jgi:hypothetical protein